MFGAMYAIDEGATDALIDVAREFSPRIEVDAPLARAVGDRPLSRAQVRQVVLDLSGLTQTVWGCARNGRGAVLHRCRSRDTRAGGDCGNTYGCTSACPCRQRICHGYRPRHGKRLCLPDCRFSGWPCLHPRSRCCPPCRPSSHPCHRTTRCLPRFAAGAFVPSATWRHYPPPPWLHGLDREGVRWQRLARGEDPRPLLPVAPEERFEQALDLEWPIEGLEPLSFVLGRLLEPLEAQLDRRGRGAAVLHVRLHLVTKTMHERSLQLPAPMRDARTLRTLALLDLESHPPVAAIDRVVIAIDPTPARVLQFSLLTRPLPSPAQISTLMARLGALMGEGRCGSPTAVDTWQPGVFAIRAFAPVDPDSGQRERTPRHLASKPRGVAEAERATTHPAVALRRFRVPVPARVRVDQHTPVRVTTDRVAMRLDQSVSARRSSSADAASAAWSVVADRVLTTRGLSGGDVQRCAGPWRTSGGWWTVPTKAWDREEMGRHADRWRDVPLSFATAAPTPGSSRASSIDCLLRATNDRALTVYIELH